MARYSFSIDHITFDAYRDGTPFTLADCWRECEGVGNARIWCGDRLVLDRAGEAATRRYRIRARYQAMRGIMAERRRESYAALSGIPAERRVA